MFVVPNKARLGGASYYSTHKTEKYFDISSPDYRKAVSIDRTEADVVKFIEDNKLSIDLTDYRVKIIKDDNWPDVPGHAYYGPQYSDVNSKIYNKTVGLVDLVTKGKTNIYVKQSVVNSNEGLIATLTHETYEIENLVSILYRRSLTMKDYDDLVGSHGGSTGRNLHTEAVVEGDEAVFSFWKSF